ncbi:MAG: DUF5654 family protein [Candidatus Aenigmatarchaeota archaeon]
MQENKSFIIKPENIIVKGIVKAIPTKESPSWRRQKRNLIIDSKVSKIKKFFKALLKTISVKRKTAAMAQKETDNEIITKAIKIDEKPSWRHEKRKMIITHEVSKFTKTFRDSFVTFIASALGLVAGLTWNEAIKTTIDTLFPTTGNLIYKFVVAGVVTAIAIVITYFISRIKSNN